MNLKLPKPDEYTPPFFLYNELIRKFRILIIYQVDCKVSSVLPKSISFLKSKIRTKIKELA